MKDYEVYQINGKWAVKHIPTNIIKIYDRSKREAELAIRYHVKNKVFPKML